MVRTGRGDADEHIAMCVSMYVSYLCMYARAVESSRKIVDQKRRRLSVVVYMFYCLTVGKKNDAVNTYVAMVI